MPLSHPTDASNSTMNSLPGRLPSLLMAGASSLVFILLVQWFTGSFFEDYEVWINQFLIGTLTERPYTVWYTNMYFALFPVLSAAQANLPFLPVYSVFSVGLLWIATTSIIYILYRKWSRQYERNIVLLLLLLVYVLLYDQYLLINCVRISILLCSAAFLWLWLLQSEGVRLSGRHLIPFALLLLGGLLARIEVAILCSMLATVYFSLFKHHRSYILTAAFALLLSFSVFKVYEYHMLHSDPYLRAAHKYERDMLDRDNFVSDSSSVAAILKEHAMRQYIYDEEVIHLEDFENSVDQEGFFNYILRNRNFFANYVWRLFGMVQLIQHYMWVWIILLPLLLLRVLKGPPRTRSWRRIIWFLLLASVPFVVSISSIMPERFLSPYLAVIVILFLADYPPFLAGRKHRILLGGIALLSIVILIDYSGKTADTARQWEAGAAAHQACLASYHEQGRIPVVGEAQLHVRYPNRLFQAPHRIEHYYVDLFFWSMYPHYKVHHDKFYGEGRTTLAGRMKAIAENEQAVLLSNESTTIFYKAYVKEFNQMDIDFLPDTGCVNENLRPYRVVIVGDTTTQVP